MIKEIQSERLREKLVHASIENGLEVYILPKKGYNKQFAVYATKYGSNDSCFIVPGESQPTSVPDGIAHFLEHKLFDQESGNVFEAYSKLGAQPNAYTSFTSTAYYFIATGSFYECTDILLDFVGKPYFTDESVEKEKGIIAQEIRMYQDNPRWRVFFNMLKGMYQKHPVKNDIAGTLESIGEIDKQTLYRCYKTFYHPSNMKLFLTGDLEPNKVIEHLEKHFEKYKATKQGDILRVNTSEPSEVVDKRIEERLPVSRPIFMLGFKDKNVGSSGQELMDNILSAQLSVDMLAGPSSCLYTRMYEQGLIDRTFYADYTGEESYGYAAFGGESLYPDSVINEIYDEINRLKQHQLDKETFLRIKNKRIGKFIRSFNSIESVGVQFLSMAFKGMNLFDYLERLEQMECSQVEERFALLLDSRLSTLSVVLPK